VRDAGTPVLIDVTGDAAAVPPAAALTAYRIVQEALTNVVRHAPGAEATVRVAAGPAGLRIQVTDTGPGWQAGGSMAGTASLASADCVAGHGITGMRERAAIFKGTLEAGPLPGRGFQVAAFLPVSVTAAGRAA
jgi:signal transduction histidine kinase